MSKTLTNKEYMVLIQESFLNGFMTAASCPDMSEAVLRGLEFEALKHAHQYLGVMSGGGK
jgi:hypothetical protein